MPGKGNQAGRLTTNRAFALRREMNQMNYAAHSRASPLDRALRPIKEVVNKKSNKKSERPFISSADEEDVSVSCAPSVSPIRELDANDQMLQRGSRRGVTDPGPYSRYQSKSNGIMVTDKKDLRVRFDEDDGNARANLDTRANLDRDQVSYRRQGSSIEDGEYVNGYGNNFRSRSAPLNDSGHANIANGDDLYGRGKDRGRTIAVEAFTDQNELIGTGKVYVTNKQKTDTGKLDQEIFVTPTGEEVKLRPKRGRNSMAEGQADSKTERFSRRLSLLCNMLAEKYPGDFHILELLVELQVSNEKREEKITKTVEKMQHKIDDMEERLSLMESVSNPGLETILRPLQQATQAFNIGVTEALKACQSRKQTRLEIPDGKEEQGDTLEDVPDINDQDFPDLNGVAELHKMNSKAGQSIAVIETEKDESARIETDL